MILSYFKILHIYCLNLSGKTQASMDTIYGMLIPDIPGNAINHDIFPSKINKGKQKKQIMGTILPLYSF